MRIIINADDFGYSTEVNSAIKKALQEGVISSTTMLVNMEGFEEAVAMAHTKDFKNRVGIHLNLFEGKPLTKEMKECRLFCNEYGTFYGEKDMNGTYIGKRIRFFDPIIINQDIIYNELHAQITKAINAGINPTHLDSHAHRHTNYFIGRIVIKLAKHFRIPSIRINNNVRKTNKIFSKPLIILYNRRLKWNGIKCVDYIGTIPEITMALPKLKGVVEIIAHPILKDGASLDSEYKSDIISLLAPFKTIEKIGYADL